MSKNREIGYLWAIKEKCAISAFPGPEVFETYIKAVLICANGDGKLAPGERNWALGHFGSLGASEALLDELTSYKADEDIGKIVSGNSVTHASRYFLVYDAIRACSADGEYSGPEKATVRVMAEKLGISAEMVGQIEELYLEETRLREKRLKLLYPDGAPM